MRKTLRLLSYTLALGIVAACEPTEPRLVPVHLYLTDAPIRSSATAPSPPGDALTVTAARVWISRAYLMPGPEEDVRGFTITDDLQEHDLLTLQDGATALLGSASIPEGRYAQLRMVVERAELTLSDGSTHTLHVPSGMQSGIKVVFPGTIAVGGTATDIVVDFDVAANFRLAPPGDPVRVLFTPLLVGTVTES